MKKLGSILISIFILGFLISSCDDEPTKYVGDRDLSPAGFIKGSISDSASGEKLSDVKIVITEILFESDFSDTVVTNANGEFFIDGITQQEYYLEINTKGYKCRTILVDVEDTLDMKNPVKLQRNHYPYNYVSVDEFPNRPESRAYYYQLDPTVFSNDRSWAIPFDASPVTVSKIHYKIDSLIVEVIRDDIKVDSLWYKFFQFSCGAALMEVPPGMVVKLEEDDQKILDHNFKPVDLNIIDWQNCFDSTASIANYYFFEE